MKTIDFKTSLSSLYTYEDRDVDLLFLPCVSLLFIIVLYYPLEAWTSASLLCCCYRWKVIQEQFLLLSHCKLLLYTQARDGTTKMSISPQFLLIQPIQRLPRYVLLISELLKYTDLDHPDYATLTKVNTIGYKGNGGHIYVIMLIWIMLTI